jgi:adenylate cyclase
VSGLLILFYTLRCYAQSVDGALRHLGTVSHCHAQRPQASSGSRAPTFGLRDCTEVMSRRNATLAIVFADISGSTRLYETLGDAVARELVSECLDLMTKYVHLHSGTVIKTIGDEIMCTYPGADEAVESTMAMQEAVTEDLPRINPNTPAELSIRVGLHYGPCILEGGDVFGDAVNVAARMSGLAKGQQIITTRDTAEALAPLLASSTRLLDRIPVKGKAEEIEIFEVIWQPDDVTRIATGLLRADKKTAVMSLRYRSREIKMDSNSGTVVMGRGKKADLIVNDSMASREHARLECRRGKFILTDQSTNGTYVQTEEGPAYLRREELQIAGVGKIALGREIAEATEIVVFECTT